MANKLNIEHILDRAHISHTNALNNNRGLILQTDKLDNVTMRQLINEGVREFTAVLNRGIINIIIEY